MKNANIIEIKAQRQKLLKQLYDARLLETKVRKAFVAIKDLTDAIGECDFNLGVLEELGHTKRDGYRIRITSKGVLAYERMLEELSD